MPYKNIFGNAFAGVKNGFFLVYLLLFVLKWYLCAASLLNLLKLFSSVNFNVLLTWLLLNKCTHQGSYNENLSVAVSY